MKSCQYDHPVLAAGLQDLLRAGLVTMQMEGEILQQVVIVSEGWLIY